MSTVGGQAAAQQPWCSSCAHCASLSSASDCTLLAGLPCSTEACQHQCAACSTQLVDCAFLAIPATNKEAPQGQILV